MNLAVVNEAVTEMNGVEHQFTEEEKNFVVQFAFRSGSKEDTISLIEALAHSADKAESDEIIVRPVRCPNPIRRLRSSTAMACRRNGLPGGTRDGRASLGATRLVRRVSLFRLLLRCREVEGSHGVQPMLEIRHAAAGHAQGRVGRVRAGTDGGLGDGSPAGVDGVRLGLACRAHRDRHGLAGAVRVGDSRGCHYFPFTCFNVLSMKSL